MKTQGWRLLLAVAIPLGCAAVTVAWYRATDNPMHASVKTEAKPLAQVMRVEGDALLRSSNHSLWFPISTGDRVMDGDTVLTPTNAAVVLRLSDGRAIELEPDSVGVLKEKNGDVSVTLVEGSLRTLAEEQNASKPVLVRVQGGVERFLRSGRIVSLNADENTPSLTVTSPPAEKPIFVNPQEPTRLTFAWRGAPDFSRVHLAMGPSPKKMRDVASLPSNAPMARIDVSVSVGRPFFRLVAKRLEDGKVIAQSPVQRLRIQGRYPPMLLSPVAGSVVRVMQVPSQLAVEWSRDAKSNSVELEISSDPQMRTAKFKETFKNQTKAVLPSFSEGDFYVRLSSRYPELSTPVKGALQKFSVAGPSSFIREPLVLSWRVPESEKTQAATGKPNFKIAWESKNREEEIAKYRLRLSSETEPASPTLQVDVQKGEYKAAIQRPGRYIASVEAIGRDGKSLGVSQPLSLVAIPPLNVEAPVSAVRTVPKAAPVPKVPRLATPQILPAEGLLKAGKDGVLELQWSAIANAKEYWLSFNKSGEAKEVARFKYQITNATIKNLMPGEYEVRVGAIDKNGRESLPSSKRLVSVPAKSSLKAPTIRRIKVD